MKKASGLTRLVASLEGVDEACGKMADDLEGEAAGLKSEMATTQTIVADVRNTRMALQAVNQRMLSGANGDPTGPLPDSPAPPPASPQLVQPVAPVSPPPPAAEPHFDRTALGMIRR